LQRVTAVVHAKLTEGVPLETLMGSTIDALKLVSSLTLFRRAAQEAGGLDPFVAHCEAILRRADEQGFPPCAHTLAQLGS
jgi:uncharacterized protein (DUF1810 family)